MLARSSASDDLLRPVQGGLADPEAIPGYEIVDEIHRGGQGVVYRAHQRSTGRIVALKIVYGGLDDTSRFDREVRTLAQLNHPNIVSIHDSGEAGKHHYFTMDYVDGGPLDTYAREYCTTVNDVLRLLAVVCDAVNAAHIRGITHRDLKPSNICVDAEGRPHVLDFGLAKSSAPDASVVTQTGQFVGSLPWASPEQALGQSSSIDQRTDVYSLGMILYQLLSGRFPYEVFGNARDVVDRIVTAEPDRLRGSREGPAPGGFSVDDEVETIVLKCLSKERERRYQTAGELASDIRRYLSGAPIDAKRDSTVYVLRKTLRRYRAAIAVASVVLIVAMAGTVFSSIYWRRAVREKAVATSRLWDSYLAQARAGRFSGRPGQRFASLDALKRAATIRPSSELRNEAIACMALPDVRGLHEWPWDKARGTPQFSPGLDRFVMTTKDGSLAVCDVADKRVIHEIGFHSDRSVACDWTAAGDRFAFNAAGVIHIWDESQSDSTVQLAQSVRLFDLRDDGRWITSFDAARRFETRDLDTDGRSSFVLEHDSDLRFMRLNPVLPLLAVGYTDGSMQVLNTQTGRLLHKLEAGAWTANQVGAWSPDGRHFAMAFDDGSVRVWDGENGEIVAGFQAHTSNALVVGFSKWNHVFATWGWDGRTRLWDARDWAPLLTIPGRAVMLSSAGDRVALRRVESETELEWEILELAHGRQCHRLAGEKITDGRDGAHGVSVAPNGRLLATGTDNGIRFWDLAAGQQVAHLDVGRADFVAFHPTRSVLFTCDETGIHEWPMVDGDDGVTVGPPKRLWDKGYMALSHDGSLIAIKDGPDHASVIESSGSRVLAQFSGHAMMNSIDISPNNAWAVTGAWQGRDAVVWDAAKGEPIRRLDIPANNNVVVSPDGQWLLTSTDTENILWDTKTWVVRRRFPRVRQSGLTGHTAFSPDGRIVAVQDSLETIQLIDLQRSEVIARLEHPEALRLAAMVFAPDNTRLICATKQGHIVYVWDLRAVRRGLRAMSLDWDLPPYSDRDPGPPAESALRVTVLTQ